MTMDTKIEDIIKGETPMEEFYKNKCLFLTGASGFFGKIIIEKLFRATDIDHIYILIRSKKGKDVYTRLEEMFDDPVFDILKRLKPKFQHKISIIKGDCTLPGLGINPEERALLQQSIDILIHAAATVRFEEKLNTALGINVCATKEIIALSRECQKLKNQGLQLELLQSEYALVLKDGDYLNGSVRFFIWAIVHVSTAFANCNHVHIDEKFYDLKLSGENACRLKECLDEETLDNITKELIGDYPNTYTFTKALAEDHVRQNSKGLPIAVFRPGVVVPTYKEPIPGWIDNVYGPVGMFVGVGTGILRVFKCNLENTAQIVPVDMTVNALLAAAWDVSANNYDEPPIYNYVPDQDNIVNWSAFLKIGYALASKMPISRSIWHPCITTTNSRFLFNILSFLYHTVPAFIVDVAFVAVGKKPKLMQIYRKAHKFLALLEYFAEKEWTFSNNNVRNLFEKMSTEDQQIFDFNIRKIDWNQLVVVSLKGVRQYIVKEDPSNMEQAIVRYKRMKILHYVLIYSLYALLIFLLYTIVSRLML